MVASPATREASASIAISRPPHSAARAVAELSGAANRRGMPIWINATSPSVAANDIWKLGCTSASGAIESTIIAATASVRNVTARRSDQDRDQHHRGHEKRALRGDLGSGQQQVKGGGQQGCDRRPFLDRKTDGERRDQRQQRADREEHDAGDHRHVIAGHVPSAIRCKLVLDCNWIAP